MLILFSGFDKDWLFNESSIQCSSLSKYQEYIVCWVGPKTNVSIPNQNRSKLGLQLFLIPRILYFLAHGIGLLPRLGELRQQLSKSFKKWES